MQPQLKPSPNPYVSPNFKPQGIDYAALPQPKVAKRPTAPVSNGIAPNPAGANLADRLNVGGFSINDVLAKVAEQDAAYQQWWLTQNPGRTLGQPAGIMPSAGPNVAIDPGPGGVTAAAPPPNPALGWLQSMIGYHPTYADPTKVRPANPYGGTGLPQVQPQQQPQLQTQAGPSLSLNDMLRNILG